MTTDLETRRDICRRQLACAGLHSGVRRACEQTLLDLDEIERLTLENERLRWLLQIAEHLLRAATGPEEPESWSKARQRLFNKIGDTAPSDGGDE